MTKRPTTRGSKFREVAKECSRFHKLENGQIEDP